MRTIYLSRHLFNLAATLGGENFPQNCGYNSQPDMEDPNADIFPGYFIAEHDVWISLESKIEEARAIAGDDVSLILTDDECAAWSAAFNVSGLNIEECSTVQMTDDEYTAINDQIGEG